MDRIGLVWRFGWKLIVIIYRCILSLSLYPFIIYYADFLFIRYSKQAKNKTKRIEKQHKLKFRDEAYFLFLFLLSSSSFSFWFHEKKNLSVCMCVCVEYSIQCQSWLILVFAITILWWLSISNSSSISSNIRRIWSISTKKLWTQFFVSSTILKRKQLKFTTKHFILFLFSLSLKRS